MMTFCCFFYCILIIFYLLSSYFLISNLEYLNMFDTSKKGSPTESIWSNWTCLRRGEHVRLRTVNADGDLSTGGTELLEESAVSPDPQVLFCDFHLRTGVNHQVRFMMDRAIFLYSFILILTYNTQVTRARCGVQTKKKACDGDHVVLNKWLYK